jgi:hypothetical protein
MHPTRILDLALDHALAVRRRRSQNVTGKRLPHPVFLFDCHMPEVYPAIPGGDPIPFGVLGMHVRYPRLPVSSGFFLGSLKVVCFQRNGFQQVALLIP